MSHDKQFRLQSMLRKGLLAFAVLGLLAGMWAGLLRLGTGWHVLHPALPISHGPLIVAGFLGTLICLERAVALGVPWAYAPPAAAASGAILIVFHYGGWAGPFLITAGSAGLVIVMATLWNRHHTLYGLALIAGAAAWLGGNLLWLFGKPIFTVVYWWMGFLILTIAGERLELSRLLRLGAMAQRLFVVCVVLLAAGMLVSIINLTPGVRILGVSMIAFAIWLLRYDIAWRRLRAGGQARFIAVCLLSGYVWLAIGGVLAVYYAGVMAGPYYDAILHSVFVGFAFAMIFGHAPIVFPAVLGLPLEFRPRFYIPLILLHTTMVIRVAGDCLLVSPLRTWGGILNVVVILLFAFNTAAAVRHSRRIAATVTASVPGT